jgi:hypothetical protein
MTSLAGDSLMGLEPGTYTVTPVVDGVEGMPATGTIADAFDPLDVELSTSYTCGYQIDVNVLSGDLASIQILSGPGSPMVNGIVSITDVEFPETYELLFTDACGENTQIDYTIEFLFPTRLGVGNTSCNIGASCNSIEYSVAPVGDRAGERPVSFEYLVNGSVVASGQNDGTTFTGSIPYACEDEVVFDMRATLNCGTVFTREVILDNEVLVIDKPENCNDCIYLSVPFSTGGMTTITYTTAPTAMNLEGTSFTQMGTACEEGTNRDDYVDYELCAAGPFEEGLYTVAIDNGCCPRSVTFNYVMPQTSIGGNSRYTCTDGEGVLFVTTSGSFVDAEVTDLNGNIVGSLACPTGDDRGFFTTELPYGTYNVEITDACGDMFTEQLTLQERSWELGADITLGCGSFNVEIRDDGQFAPVGVSSAAANFNYFVEWESSPGVWDTLASRGNIPWGGVISLDNITELGNFRLRRTQVNGSCLTCDELIFFTQNNNELDFTTLEGVQCSDGGLYTINASALGEPLAGNDITYEVRDSGDNLVASGGAESGQNYTANNLPEGTYTVVASNECGSQIREIELVDLPPLMIMGEASYCAGSDATLSIGGFSFLDFVWTDPAGNVVSTGSTLDISNVSTADAGTYTVMVTSAGNACINSTLTFELNVETERILEVVGDNNLDCDAESCYTFTYTSPDADEDIVINWDIRSNNSGFPFPTSITLTAEDVVSTSNGITTYTKQLCQTFSVPPGTPGATNQAVSIENFVVTTPSGCDVSVPDRFRNISKGVAPISNIEVFSDSNEVTCGGTATFTIESRSGVNSMITYEINGMSVTEPFGLASQDPDGDGLYVLTVTVPNVNAPTTLELVGQTYTSGFCDRLFDGGNLSVETVSIAECAAPIIEVCAGTRNTTQTFPADCNNTICSGEEFSLSMRNTNPEVTAVVFTDQPNDPGIPGLNFPGWDSGQFTLNGNFYQGYDGAITNTGTTTACFTIDVTVANADCADCVSPEAFTVEVCVLPEAQEPVAVNCWDEFVLEGGNCGTYTNVGEQPEMPTMVNCWDDFQFNDATCTWDNVGDPNTPVGCTNPNSANYDPAAVCDDGSCIGCPQPNAAEISMVVGTTTLLCSGDDAEVCFVVNGTNSEDFQATVIYTVDGVENTAIVDFDGAVSTTAKTTVTLSNITNTTTVSLVGAYIGSPNCATDNFIIQSSETITVDPNAVLGCTDPTALNYNPAATCDDGSCDADPCEGINPITPSLSVSSNTLCEGQMLEICVTGEPNAEYAVTEDGDISPFLGAVFRTDANGSACQTITTIGAGSGTFNLVSFQEGSCTIRYEDLDISELVIVSPAPDQPQAVNCWDDYVLDNTTCTWNNMGIENINSIQVGVTRDDPNCDGSGSFCFTVLSPQDPASFSPVTIDYVVAGQPTPTAVVVSGSDFTTQATSGPQAGLYYYRACGQSYSLATQDNYAIQSYTATDGICTQSGTPTNQIAERFTRRPIEQMFTDVSEVTCGGDATVCFISGGSNSESYLVEFVYEVNGVQFNETIDGDLDQLPNDDRQKCVTLSNLTETTTINLISSVENITCPIFYDFTETITIDPSSLGCTDPTALNYNPAATCDDGSCDADPCEGINPVFSLLPSFFRTTDCDNAQACFTLRSPIAPADFGTFTLQYTVDGVASSVTLDASNATGSPIGGLQNYQVCDNNLYAFAVASSYTLDAGSVTLTDVAGCVQSIDNASRTTTQFEALREVMLVVDVTEVECGGDASICFTTTGSNSDDFTSNFEYTINGQPFSGTIDGDDDQVDNRLRKVTIPLSGLTSNTVIELVSSADPGQCPRVYNGVVETVTVGDCGNTGCTVFNFEDFENGYGIWNDGGTDCYLNYEPAQGGNGSNYCVRTRDNSGWNSSLYTSPQDFSCASEIRVDFMYLPESMESGEDFFLEYSTDGGATFATAAQWVSGVHFQNGNFYNETTSITGTFTSSTVLRFRCDASNNSDRVYLDNISISLCGCDSGNPASCNGAISSFELINPGGHVINAITDGDTYCGSDYSTSWTRVRVGATGDHQSVLITVTGPAGTVSKTENLETYDSDWIWAAYAGTYTVTAKLYSEDNLGGMACDERTISFTVVDCNQPTFDCPSLSLNIGDACDDGDALTENDVVNSNCQCAGTPVVDNCSRKILTISNDGICAVNVYWWIATGDVYYATLDAGQQWSVQTSPSHVWRVVDTHNDWNNLKHDESYTVGEDCEQTWRVNPTYCDQTGGGNTGDCSSTLVHYQGFESGWGQWIDGGTDCTRYYDPNIDIAGNYCVRLRDNTHNNSSAIIGNLNFDGVQQVTVDFIYIAKSMEHGEDFMLEYSNDGGLTYTTVQSWRSGTDFYNGETKKVTVAFSGSFSSTTKIRFRCDATSNYDIIYLDEIYVYACGGSWLSNGGNIAYASTQSESLTMDLQNESFATPASDLQVDGVEALGSKSPVVEVYPIPSTDIVNVKGLDGQTYDVYSIAGQRIIKDSNDQVLDISGFQDGTYLLRASDGQIVRFVKM